MEIKTENEFNEFINNNYALVDFMLIGVDLVKCYHQYWKN